MKSKIPKELRFRKYTVKQLREIKKSNPRKFKSLYKRFNEKYDKLYKKYVLDRRLPSSHPILKQLDKWDRQLGRFHKVSPLEVVKNQYSSS